MAVDNDNLAAKLALRRHFLQAYHTDGNARVFDCCQGSAVIWTTLRAEHKIASYWGVDLKPKSGRLKIDSVRVLEQPGWLENIIDVDTYGAPWKHWSAILRNAKGPTTVFLTIGQHGRGGGMTGIQGEVRDVLALPPSTPPMLAAKVAHTAVDRMLATCLGNWSVIEAKEARPGERARYIGVRIEPKSR